MNKTISYIYVILSAVCWGFIGFSNRLLTEAVNFSMPFLLFYS